MSAARGPKPSIAPKPKVTLELFSGSQGGCVNGSLLTSDGEPDKETENRRHKVTADRLTAEKQSYILESPLEDFQNVSEGPEDGEVTEEEKDEMIKKMDEDWRLTDSSAVTEEVDSLEALWVSDAGLTADSAMERIDTDMTEDMDEDAGEALADTDGLSMGDISVNSVDEEAGCYPVELENGHMREKLHIKADEIVDSTADDLTESLTDDVIVSENNTEDIDTQQLFLIEEDEKEEESDCGITYSSLKLRSRHKVKEKGENQQPCSFIDEQIIRYHDFIPKDKLCTKHLALEDGPTHEPYYIATEDIIDRDMIPKMNKVHESPLTPQSLLCVNTGGNTGKYQMANGKIGQTQCVSLEDYVEVANRDEVRARQERMLVRTEEYKLDALLNHLNRQPSFRLLCNSVPTHGGTSLTSSLSEDQLISPNSSDSFRDEDDLEGHVVPFEDDTTDTEQDISDEHVYEDPGHSSEGENVFPVNTRTRGMRSCSLSQHMNNDAAEIGVKFVQGPCMSRYGQKGPALSSSPMLSSTRHKSYSKPHYLSLYPRSLSMEGQDSRLCVYRDSEGSPRQRGAVCSSGRFSRCSPPSSSGLSTPTSMVDIPPPFELAYITKRPITKSYPSLLIEGDSSEKNRNKKSSLKRFLMLKFRRKAENKPLVDDNLFSFKSSPESSHHATSRLLDLDRHSLSGSPQLNSRSASKAQASPEPSSAFLFHPDSKRKGNSVAFLTRNVVRVESFEDRSRVAYTPLPLTKPRSISFPNVDTSEYENVPAIHSDYENLQVPQRRPVRQGLFSDFFDRPTRVLSSANETDGYVDMSSLPGFQSRTQSSEQEAER